MLSNCLLVHSNNTCLKNQIVNNIQFRLDASENYNLDTYITKTIIPMIKESTFDILVIKDTLSDNYLDFYGLLLLLHIRLSSELESKRFTPIVIISDFELDLINRLSPFANVLFTPNTYFSSQEDIESTIGNINNFKKLNENNFKELFLDRIEIKTPKDYLSKHSISNEWSIYKWSNLLNINNDSAINVIYETITLSLYFKYLKAKFDLNYKSSDIVDFQISDNAKVLYIDDEWEKGWNLIFNKLFEGKDYKCIEETFKDKNAGEIKDLALVYINDFKPDVVILDLRLCDDDFDDIPIDKMSGTLVLKEIKNINPGIQCIMFTATGRSVYLNYLNEIGILGYIKKESPDDSLTTTSDNIMKLESLVNKGIENKYLIEVYELSKLMLNHIQGSFHDFNQNDIGFLEKNIEIIFDILNSNTLNKFNYSMLTIYKCLEIIKDALTHVSSNGNSVYVKDNCAQRHTRSEIGRNENGYTSTRNRLHICMAEKLDFSTTSDEYIEIPIIVRRRNDYIHPENNFLDVRVSEILKWTKMLKEIVLKLS